MIDLLPWIVDAVVIGAVAGATITTVGMLRMPDLFTQVHAAALLPFVTLAPLALVQFVHGQIALGAKALLVVAFLLLTTAVSSHVIANAAHARRRDRREQERERE